MLERFGPFPTVRAAILSTLDDLLDGWASHQGMSPESFSNLNSALVSPLEALRSVDPGAAIYTSDQLCQAWAKVRGSIEWYG
jgi:hypothetical protein